MENINNVVSRTSFVVEYTSYTEYTARLGSVQQPNTYGSIWTCASGQDPVAVWDQDANPVAPDVSFSYSITGSDKDTFIRITNASTNPPTTETQQFPQGVDLFHLEIQYAVAGGTSGYSAGVHTWVYAGHGITVSPKPKTGDPVPTEIPAKTYINRHMAKDVMPQTSILYDAPYIVNVTLTRAAYTTWLSKELPIGGSPGGQ